jgi:hypothetical protein
VVDSCHKRERRQVIAEEDILRCSDAGIGVGWEELVKCCVDVEEERGVSADQRDLEPIGRSIRREDSHCRSGLSLEIAIVPLAFQEALDMLHIRLPIDLGICTL